MLLYGLMILRNTLQALWNQQMYLGIVIDEDARTADIIFATNDQLARAIGSQGQNIRLASELTGYKLDMML